MTRLKILTITCLCLMLTVVSCESDSGTAEPECFEHFNYDEASEEGPSHWANYCVDEGTVNECGSTIRQSPINIAGAVNDETLSDLDITYTNSSTDVINNGHTIQFNYNGATSNLIFEGETYSLLQLHFHAESEHTIEGSHYPLEAHLVHKNASGDLAVIGVFFELGEENEFLAEFTEYLPEHENDTFIDADLFYNASALVHPQSSYYNYGGSLTTPPCSEIVEWIILEQPLEASQTQLDAFSNILHDNFRPIQPLSGRTIKHKN